MHVQNNNEIISQVLQSSMIPTFVIGKDHTVTHWNRACERQTSISANDIVGTNKHWMAFYSEEQSTMSDYLVKGESKEEIAGHFGGRLRDSPFMDGAYEIEGFFSDLGEKGRWLFITVAPVNNAQGNIIGAIGTFQDISKRKLLEETLINTQGDLERKVEERTTELQRINSQLQKEIKRRKAVEEALRLSEKKFRTVADFTYDWEYWRDHNGNYVYISPSCERVTGYSIKEFQANPNLIVSITHPDDQAQLLLHLDDESENTEVFHLDFRIISHQGEERWISHLCQPVLDTEGNYLGRRASNRDVTKRIVAEIALRKERENLESRVKERTKELSSAYSRLQKEIDERTRAYKALQFTRFSIEHSDDSLYWIDNKGSLVDVNQTTCNKLGYKKEELLAMKVMDIVTGFSFDEYMKTWNILIQYKTWRLEISHSCKDGKIIPVEIHLNYLEFGGQGYICAIARDISERKELERLVAIQDKMSSLGRVAAGIAHEIRNPLSTINVYLDTVNRLLSFDEIDTGVVTNILEAVAEMDAASSKIETVVRRVMDFSSPSQQKMQLMCVNQCIKDAVNLSAVSLRKSGVILELKLNDGLPESYMDKLSIEQVILNLITNAREELIESEGERNIEILTEKRDTQEGERQIIIIVADSGPGVPPELQNKIFDPFFTTKNYGSGIGLSICLRIINDHQGTLQVETSKWGGAQFVVGIPVKKEMGL